MKKILTLLFALNTVIVTTASAQRGMHQGKMQSMEHNYDINTVTRFNGTVEKIEEIPAGKGMGTGLHLMVKTSKETIEVHIGPKSYVDKQNFHVSKGDKIAVEGSRITMNGKNVIIAREVKRGSATLTLRDQKGIPMWSGGKE